MSELTREEILKLIEENGGPRGLDLSGKDLSGIDLSREAIQAELEKVRERAPDETPVWCRERTEGMNLGDADFQGADLVDANLQGAYLWRANLQKANLRGTDLQGAYLGVANLQEAYLWGANLQKANLGGANLEGAFLMETNLKEALLRNTNLEGAELLVTSLQGAHATRANFQGANLEGSNLEGTFLWGANFKYAFLKGTDLEGALLKDANLEGTILWDANLRGAKLTGANLQGADLSHSHLEKVDFFTVESIKGGYFYNAFLDDTRLKREQLGEAIGEDLYDEYDKAREAYLALKNNFAEIGRYRDESWAYVKERQMGKMMHHPRLARKYYGKELPENPSTWRLWWFYFRHTAKWLTDWFIELLCDYGESLWRVLAWMLLVILGFATYYQVSHAVVTSSQDAVTSLWDHLIFSLGAFTTLQPARLQAASPGVELWATIQAIIGISLAGLLGFVAGNRIRRS